MRSLFNAVRCTQCSHDLALDILPGNCPHCGSSWVEARYDLAALPAAWPQMVAARAADMWRYRELLPFDEQVRPVTMGEGWTPLVQAETLQAELGHPAIWIKDERQQPTGSFKDRQAACSVTGLKAKGIEEVVLASAGNAAAAYAAFCARAGIKLWVFLTNSVPVEKMRELALYNAQVIKVTGTYDQAKHIAAQFAEQRGLYLDAGAKAIPNKESMKTIAFEIAEQLGWRAPDWYIQAVSGGLGPLGVLKGFEELAAAGLIDKVPKIGIVQVEGCAPMARSWQKGLERAEPEIPDTLISVLATGDPGLAYPILKKGIEAYGGAMVAVDDGAAFRAMRRLARLEGFSTEPAASVAFAGMEKLLADGYISPEECVVVNCSGHTFSAEKHALEDRYIVDLNIETAAAASGQPEGLAVALDQIDERITTIVIIDDNPRDCRLMRRLLRRYKNYRIFEAYTGEDGIDMVRQHRPGLVILDLVLADTDGFTILEKLKADARTGDVPVLIVSGKDLTLNQKEYLDHHAEAVWQKGAFSGRELANYVVDLLGGDHTAVSLPESGSWDAKHGSLPVRGFGDSHKPRILVVDDNVWEARLTRRLFEARQRFEVIEAHSAGEGLRLAETVRPNLIILDLILPDASGEDTLARLRASQATADIPVVIVSAKELGAESRARLSTNAESVWSKSSLDRNHLLDHIETILTE